MKRTTGVGDNKGTSGVCDLHAIGGVDGGVDSAPGKVDRHGGLGGPGKIGYTSAARDDYWREDIIGKLGVE